MDRMNASFPTYRAPFPCGEPEPFAGSLPFHLDGYGAPEDFDFPDPADAGDASERGELRRIGSAGSVELDALLGSASRRSSASTGSMMDYLDLALGSFGGSLDDSNLRLSVGSGGTGSRGRGPAKRSRRGSATPSLKQRCERAAPPETARPVPLLPRSTGSRFQVLPAVDLDPPSLAPFPPLQLPAILAPPPASPETQRSEQLDRLAASMRRTGASRRCVMLQRELLFTPEQRRQLDATKDELRRCTLMQCQWHQEQREGIRGPSPPPIGAGAAFPPPLGPLGRSAAWVFPPPQPGADAAAGGAPRPRSTPQSLMEQSQKQFEKYMKTTL